MKLRLLPVLMAVLVFFGGCTAGGAAGLKPAEASPGCQRRYYSGINYELPEDWTYRDGESFGVYHYPPDGGMLFVSKGAFKPIDTEQPAEVLDKEIGALGSILNNIEVDSYEEGEFQGNEARYLWARADALTDEESGESLLQVPIYAVVFMHNDFPYSMVFAFPHGQSCEMEQHYQEVLASVVLAGHTPVDSQGSPLAEAEAN